MGIDEKKILEELVIKAKSGDIKAKEEIIKKYRKTVECKASRYLIKGFDREDLISEGYRALLIAITKYNESKECFHTYATRAIENRLIDLLRVNKENDDKKSISLTDEISDFLKSDEMNVEDKAYYTLLRNKICELPKDEGDVIRKIYLNEKTIREIAKEKGVSYSRVQYLRNKGLRSLKILI